MCSLVYRERKESVSLRDVRECYNEYESNASIKLIGVPLSRSLQNVCLYVR